MQAIVPYTGDDLHYQAWADATVLVLYHILGNSGKGSHWVKIFYKTKLGEVDGRATVSRFLLTKTPSGRHDGSDLEQAWLEIRDAE